MGTSRGDHVLPFIEESLIQANLSAETVLRLIAIQSLASKGLRPTVLNTYLRLFIQVIDVFKLYFGNFVGRIILIEINYHTI